MKFIVSVFLTVCTVLCAAAQQPVDLTVAAERAQSSVVYIKVTINARQRTVTYRDPFADFFGDSPFSDFFGRGNGGNRQRQVETPKQQAAGSGVILSEDGYIVTNNHVVANADEIQVKMNDNREFKARIIGTDEASDLALIKVEQNGLPAIKVGSSADLKVGEWVLAIGNPLGLTSTVTAGIISAKARTVGRGRETGGQSIESFIQTDAAINQGNSGGALVNVRGELVGINAMLVSQTGSYSGYGFAIPTTIMQNVVEDLKRYGSVQRAVLGISGMDVSSYIDKLQAEEKEVPDFGTVSGVYISEVSRDGAAAAAGLKSGDVITSVDGHNVSKMAELAELLSGYKPGDKVRLTYMRDKKTYEKTIELRNLQGTTSAVEAVDEFTLGVALRPLTDSEKKELSLSYGLVVISLKPGKMQEAGLTKGVILTKINDRELRSTDDFNAVVKEANLSTDRVLWIRAKTQSGLNKSYTVELGEKKEK
ncbi:MAG: Do family serine endopeptidase [Christensenellaceae bacterium]|nr:Do family serine endopeptidase [Christensenellaceae bacterium]